MKRFFNIGMVLVLVMLSVPISQTALGSGAPISIPQPSTEHDSTPLPNRLAVSQLNHDGNSPTPPDPKDDEHFVTDTGGWLDQYLYRKDAPNGRLTFMIEIDRYYSPWIQVDANGFLTDSVAEALIDGHLLPEKAILTLEVWDVDHEASGCPEVDHVYINDQQVQNADGSPATLTSGNDTWSTWSISFPIEMLKFPTDKGSNGGRPDPKLNEIAVEINTRQCADPDDPSVEWWAVEVDWGAIFIPSPIRPIVFVHGWTGRGSDDLGEASFAEMRGFVEDDGIPSAEPISLARGIQQIPDTALMLINEEHGIKKTAAEFGVDKVNLFAHSKGGLVSRWALKFPIVAKMVDHLVTFSTPHHGVDWFRDLIKYKNCLFGGFSDEERDACFESAEEFSEEKIRNYNYDCQWDWWLGWECNPTSFAQAQQGVKYFSLVGDELIDISHETATFPWKAIGKPYPLIPNVDAWFITDHGGIIKNQSAYKCAVSYVDSDIHSSLWCLSPVLSQASIEANTEPIWPDGDAQVVLDVAGNLSAGTNDAISVTLDSGTQVIFTLISDTPILFQLQDPAEQTIDPSTTDPAITYVEVEDEYGWLYQYAVENPPVGNWQNTISASAEAAYHIVTMLSSDVALVYSIDQYTHRPDEQVTVEAALLESDTPLAGSSIDLTVTRPDDSTLTLALVDDGTNGDVMVGDSIYTGQFNSTSQMGYHTLDFKATNDDITRLERSSLAVAAQTAQFQAVTGESTVDSNSNGLYDWLNLDIQLDVLTSGHFEVSGVLADGNGDVVASSTFATLYDGSDPLPLGLQTIVLPFDGETIRAHGIDGSYTLERVVVRDQTEGDFEVDSVTSAYTTASYQSRQFEGALLSIVAGSESTPDTDLDGLYDELAISLNMEVISPGNYAWNGRLVDAAGAEIGWARGSGYLDDFNPLELTFDGEMINASELNGPYTLRNLSAYQTSGGSTSVFFDAAYTTQSYSFTDFEQRFYVYLPLAVRIYGGRANYNWLDATSGGTIVAEGDDTYEYVSLPFSFTFYGHTYSGLYVSSNGFVSFGSGYSTYGNSCIPSTGTPNNSIYAFWDDLRPTGGSDGNVYVKQVDSSTFVIEWYQVKRFGSTDYETFEIVLRSDDSIILQYQSVSYTGSATVGVENAIGTLAQQYLCNGVGSPLTNQLAIRYTTP